MTRLNQYNESNKRIAIALGDPAGIGMEIILKAIDSEELPAKLHPVLVGCKKSLEKTYQQLSQKGVLSIANPKNLEIDDYPIKGSFIPGQPSPETGEASFKWLTKATELVLTGKVDALVTAPIAKHAWHSAGHIYNGQTERLAELAGCDHASMLFTAVSPINGWRLNTLLATTHIPLIEVPKKLTPELIEKKLTTLANFCQKFKKNPTLAIAGLNPHAGEKGSLGTEEDQWLTPLLNEWKIKHPNIKIYGPLPPDTCWLSASHAWNGTPSNETPDGILALYHDQGLIPIKLIAFEKAVNTTLGLPFIRTSPDHGTAFDIAGLGFAKADSMLAAIQTALDFS